MEYTKEQLNEDLHVILKDNIKTEDLLEVLSWKKWRVIESVTVKSGETDKVVYTVSEIDAVPRKVNGFDLLVYMLSGFSYCKGRTNSLQWKPCTLIGHNTFGHPITKRQEFSTREECQDFIDCSIQKVTKSETTHTIIDIQSE